MRVCALFRLFHLLSWAFLICFFHWNRVSFFYIHLYVSFRMENTVMSHVSSLLLKWKIWVLLSFEATTTSTTAQKKNNTTRNTPNHKNDMPTWKTICYTWFMNIWRKNGLPANVRVSSSDLGISLYPSFYFNSFGNTRCVYVCLCILSTESFLMNFNILHKLNILFG